MRKLSIEEIRELRAADILNEIKSQHLNREQSKGRTELNEVLIRILKN